MIIEKSDKLNRRRLKTVGSICYVQDFKVNKFEMSDNQVKDFSNFIYDNLLDISKYIKNNKEDYDKWLKKENR